MRRKIRVKRNLATDPVYNSVKVTKFVNYIMERGKKNAARKVVYGAFETIKEKAKTENPIEIFDTALKNTAPNMEVRSRRVGGANYQVPVEVRMDRSIALGMRWIVQSSRSRGEKGMMLRLAGELVDAYESKGSAVKKREDTHKMAEANRAFAHYKW